MRTTTYATLVVFGWSVLMTCSLSLGAKQEMRLSPQNATQTGFAVSTEAAKEEGAVTIVILRDLSKARSFGADSGLTVRREATLRVFSDKGLLINCRIEPELQKGAAKYRITLAKDLVAHAHLTVAEIDDYKELVGREHLLGGGTFFELNLQEFVSN